MVVCLTTLYWHAVIALARLRCRVLGHQDVTMVKHGYAVVHCRRCWRVSLARVAP